VAVTVLSLAATGTVTGTGYGWLLRTRVRPCAVQPGFWCPCAVSPHMLLLGHITCHPVPHPLSRHHPPFATCGVSWRWQWRALQRGLLLYAPLVCRCCRQQLPNVPSKNYVCVTPGFVSPPNCYCVFFYSTRLADDTPFTFIGSFCVFFPVFCS
jgi:hypothetical protein